MEIDFFKRFKLDDVPLDEDTCVVRLTTSYWKDDKGLHQRKDLLFLKRKSKGFNILKEDASDIGVEDVMIRINNLFDCVDGVYKVITIDHEKNWESGAIEDYDYKLVKYEE